MEISLIVWIFLQLVFSLSIVWAAELQRIHHRQWAAPWRIHYRLPIFSNKQHYSKTSRWHWNHDRQPTQSCNCCLRFRKIKYGCLKHTSLHHQIKAWTNDAWILQNFCISGQSYSIYLQQSNSHSQISRKDCSKSWGICATEIPRYVQPFQAQHNLSTATADFATILAWPVSEAYIAE